MANQIQPPNRKQMNEGMRPSSKPPTIAEQKAGQIVPGKPLTIAQKKLIKKFKTDLPTALKFQKQEIEIKEGDRG